MLQCLVERGIDCVAIGLVHKYGVRCVLHICVSLGSQKKKISPVIQVVLVGMWETILCGHTPTDLEGNVITNRLSVLSVSPSCTPQRYQLAHFLRILTLTGMEPVV